VLPSCRRVVATLERLEPGADCPNGGVQLTVPGKAPQVVCDGAGSSGMNGTTGSNGSNGDAGDNGANGQPPRPSEGFAHEVMVDSKTELAHSVNDREQSRGRSAQERRGAYHRQSKPKRTRPIRERRVPEFLRSCFSEL